MGAGRIGARRTGARGCMELQRAVRNRVSAVPAGSCAEASCEPARGGALAGALLTTHRRPARSISCFPSYEVLEFEPGKKLVLSGLSEHHTQLDQFIFMPDKSMTGMTVRGGVGRGLAVAGLGRGATGTCTDGSSSCLK
jgi:hypothetical protein